MPRAVNNHQPLWERISVFASGLILVGSIMWIALIVPNPTDFQYTVFRIVLSLSGTAFAALIPGSIEIKYRSLIRAGGALAVLVIIYFFTPANPAGGSNVDIEGDCNVVGESGSINCNNG